MSNPIFFALLLLSLCLWYIVKLSYTYTTDINIPIKIDQTPYTVRCNVEGVGYNILLHNIAPKKNLVRISADNVDVSPSATVPGGYEISSFTLQNLISSKITDLKINSVASPVEIELPSSDKEDQE